MSVPDSTAADVKAAEPAEVKPTAPEAPSADENKETDSTLTDQEQADKEIADDLAKETKKNAKDSSDGTADDEEEPEKPEEKPEGEADDKETDEQKAEEVAKGAEARKLALQTEIRELVATRNKARADVEAENAKAYRTETPEELVEQGLTPEEAENEALRQEIQMREFNTHVADLNATLNIESLQVMQDFPVFDSDSPEFDQDLSNRVRDLYQKAAQPQVDQRTGLVTKSNLPPYEFYKAFADTHSSSGQKSRAEGQIEGQKAADKQLAAAETPTSTAPRKKAEDPFLKGLLSPND